METSDWDQYSERGLLAAVIDPLDTLGYKNALIDRIQWDVLSNEISGASRLLDLGCGTGRFCRRISKKGVNYVGLDISQGMLAQANKHHLGGPFSFVRGDVRVLPFKASSFDLCLTTGVLQYLVHSDQRALADEISSILAPAGRLCAIEQASTSNSFSSTVGRVVTESDYITLLAPSFDRISVKRVRCSFFSKTAQRYMKRANWLPSLGRLLLPAIARLERYSLTKKRTSDFLQMPYYDILVKAYRKNG